MKFSIRVSLACAGVASLALLAPAVPVQAQSIDSAALQQIRDLLLEKESRTEVQRKLGSQLVYALKAATGQSLTATIDSFPGVASSLDNVAGKGVLVDIRAAVSGGLLSAITAGGGTVISSSPRYQRIRARLLLTQIESLAGRADVQFIKPGARARVQGAGAGQSPSRLAATVLEAHAMRAIAATSPSFDLTRRLGISFFIGSLNTQGDLSHSANLARSTYGINGTGVKVGVLSDSAEATAFLIGTGDLGPDTTIVQDIVDGPGSSEGSAMMEIVHDLAPGAQLFFASAFNGDASFADNIRTLRDTYHCDVIVDDVSYSGEFPFQDGIIAQAVNDVTASGAIYFSSAGNSGNATNGNSSTWEGDFVSAGPSAVPLPVGYTLHSFNGQAFNRVLAVSQVLDLFWSDPAGASANDYDLFVLKADGTSVLAAATDIQSGTQDPWEEIFDPTGFPANSRVVIVAKAGAAPRALHLETFTGTRLQIATTGSTHGHSGGPSTTSVAAVYWNSARIGTKPFIGGAANPTEVFSSDGPRKMFYTAAGAAITPGNLLFGTNGGVTLLKPDIGAADGVTTRTPGFSPFFGTSAAAPHAAGVAALVKAAKPSITGAQIYNAMTSTALDIRAPGLDRDSGFGIVMAPAAIAKALQ